MSQPYELAPDWYLSDQMVDLTAAKRLRQRRFGTGSCHGGLKEPLHAVAYCAYRFT